MNVYADSWPLMEEVCPCDIHFNDWVETQKMTGKTIFHFGTGAHHIVGLRQAERGNAVFGITASVAEYEAYMKLASAQPRMARNYVATFGDIYLANPRLWPDFDIVTLFHLCEFFQPATVSAEYGGMSDRALLDLVTAKTRPGGFILFYARSMAFETARPIIADWEMERGMIRVGEHKTLVVYRTAG